MVAVVKVCKIDIMKKIAAYIALVGVCCFANECMGQQRSGKAAVKQEGDIYSINVQNTSLKIAPSIGGRIMALTLNGKDFLTDSTVNDFNYGSTFWLSPQSDWNWPPSAEVDNKPYTATIQNNELRMVSRPDPKTGIVITKRFSGNKTNGSYSLSYTMSNHSDSVQHVAPWEVTRVHTNGLAFFPMGEGDLRGGLIPLMKLTDGIAWFTYDGAKLPLKGDRQIYTDGSEGWLAQLNNGILLVQQARDIPKEKAAPKEGEIELYASPVKPGKSYVEIEHQGEYKELKPGESSTWEVTWFLRKLPKSIKTSVGDASLVSYVRRLLQITGN